MTRDDTLAGFWRIVQTRRVQASWRILLLVLLAGCTAPIDRERASAAAYHRALAATESAKRPLLREGAANEVASIDRFVDFYREYKPETVREGVRELYAADAFFRDPFTEVEGIDAIEEYFMRGAENADVVKFEIGSVAESGGNYYFRWLMKYQANRDDSQPLDEAVGMSHVRFDPTGKVIFQQDYWDPARGIYEKVPLLGWVIWRIRARFD
jgi:steroid Delta-isomerase